MLIVLDQGGFVLGICIHVANVPKIVAVKEIPCIPKGGSITFEALDGEMITIVDSTPVEMLGELTEIKPIPIMPLINHDRDIWDDVDDFVFGDE